MKKIVECIPNFSEGKDKTVIDAIVKAITDVPGIILLNQESDPAHNRSVVTFAGEPKPVVEAAFQGIKKAAELIDLDKHVGEHPRMGATDVVPFVPLKGVKIKDCIEYAEKLGERVGEELKIPVYLYEKAARTPERENLAAVRKGEYETIKKEIDQSPEKKPDFGPMEVPKAGVTAIGAREPLIAYNVNLETNDLSIAKNIAKTIRYKTGGFKNVKALGFDLEDRGIVQVSMNLTNYKESTVHHVFEAIKREAQRYGVGISESEVVGLIPEKAIIEAAKYYLQMNGLKNSQILERILQKKMEKTREYLDGFIENVASRKPVPGGGSVSALAGSLAAALASMVASLTINSKRYEEIHPEMEKILIKTETLRKTLFKQIQEDADAYQKVVAAYKTEEGKEEAIQKALKEAALSPLAIAETAVDLLDPISTVAEKGNSNAISDCGVALYMTETAVKGAILNIFINLKEITDEAFTREMRGKAEALLSTLREKGEKINSVVLEGVL